MAKLRGDKSTLDLLNWTPEKLEIARFDDEQVRAAAIGGKISKAITTILMDAKLREDAPLNRTDVAKKMTDWLDHEVTENMLSAYCSEARIDHNISLPRAIALMVVTEDSRLLSLIADEIGLAVIPKKYEGTVKEAILLEQKEELEKEITLLRGKRK